jgi:hypothetical protein
MRGRKRPKIVSAGWEMMCRSRSAAAEGVASATYSVQLVYVYVYGSCHVYRRFMSRTITSACQRLVAEPQSSHNLLRSSFIEHSHNTSSKMSLCNYS